MTNAAASTVSFGSRIRVVGITAVLAALIASGCTSSRDLEYKQVEADALRQQVQDLEAQLAKRGKEEAGKAIDAVPAATPDIKKTEIGVGANVGVGTRDKDIVLTIESGVLFKPGSARLSSNAQTILGRVVGTIQKQYPNHYVRVEGHTDDQKISRSKDQWEDNWDLSGGRAQEVLRYLDKHGLDSKNLSFAGYGAQRSLDKATTDAARAKNRRVEIVVISK